jgi:hypothetical protein
MSDKELQYSFKNNPQNMQYNVAHTATIQDGVWIVNWIYWISIQYTQLKCKHFTANSQLSLSDVLSGWQPLLWHPLPSLISSA